MVFLWASSRHAFLYWLFNISCSKFIYIYRFCNLKWQKWQTNWTERKNSREFAVLKGEYKCAWYLKATILKEIPHEFHFTKMAYNSLNIFQLSRPSCFELRHNRLFSMDYAQSSYRKKNRKWVFCQSMLLAKVVLLPLFLLVPEIIDVLKMLDFVLVETTNRIPCSSTAHR